MYYDLNIAWPVRIPSAGDSGQPGGAASGKKQKGNQAGAAAAASDASTQRTGTDSLTTEDRLQLEKCVKIAIKLGYATIAFNATLPLNGWDSNTIASYNPCLDQKPVFPHLDTRTAESSSGQRTVLQLSRLTVLLDEKSINGGKGNGSMFTATSANAVAGYNLIAAQPLDAPSFSHVCLNLSAPGQTGVDIITIDLASSPRLPFQLKRSMVLKAVADGAMFEVCYGPAMRLNTSTGASLSLPKEARRNIIAGARELVRVTNGKGIIMSSEVKQALEMRAPLDLCNLGTILGFKPDQAKNAVSGNARLAVIRGHAARQTYRGVISNPRLVSAGAANTNSNAAPSAGAALISTQVTPNSLKRKRIDEREEAEARKKKP